MRLSWDRRLAAPLVLATALLVAACGTTVSLPGGASQAAGGPAAGAPNSGLTVPSAGPGPAVGGGPSTAAGASSAGSTGPVAGSNPAGGPTGNGGPVVSTAQAGPFAAGVPGVTPTAIYVGLGYAVNSAAANSAIGAKGITQGDERGYDQTVLDEINRHGGILGRKLIPVYHEYDSTSTETTDQQFEAACAQWTQDNKVFVVFDGESETLIRCLEKAGVWMVEDNVTPFDDATYRAFPDYYQVGNFTMDRMMVDEAPALAAQHFFTGWDALNGVPSATHAKLGILTYDRSTTAHAVDKVLIPELARLGYAPAAADVIKVGYPKSTADLGGLSGQVSNAVLKFHQDGVDHVLIVDVSGTLTLLFLNNAQSQHYFPRYGFNSQNAAELILEQGDAPAAQFAGSLGFGWTPLEDLTAADDPDNGPYSTQPRRDCEKLMARHGYTFSDPNAAAVALLTCNSFNFLVQVLDRAQAPIDRISIRAAVAGLGTSFIPTDILAPTSFAADKHYAGATIRYWDYEPACTCMRYLGGPIRG